MSRVLSASSTRRLDLLMLDELLEREDLREDEREAFADMRGWLQTWVEKSLSDKQRAWVDRRHGELVERYENLVSSGRCPRGREVETPAVLKNLPLRPPGRS